MDGYVYCNSTNNFRLIDVFYTESMSQFVFAYQFVVTPLWSKNVYTILYRKPKCKTYHYRYYTYHYSVALTNQFQVLNCIDRPLLRFPFYYPISDPFASAQTYSSTSVGRYDPKRGFTIEIRSITDGGEYYCRPSPPFPHNEEEYTSVEVHFIGNGHIDSEFLHPKVCDFRLYMS